MPQPEPSLSGFSLPARVRAGAASVAAQADFVHIRQDRISPYVAELLDRYPIVTALDAQNHFLSAASPTETAAYVLALDSVNFGSGWFGIAEQAGVALEYSNIAGGLKEAFAKGRMNSSPEWCAVTAQDFHEMLGVPAGRHPALDALMEKFAAHLKATGDRLAEAHGGDVLHLVAAAKNSATKLAELVAGWPSFRDVAAYKGRDVPLYKRAQILAADMHLALAGRAPADFSDMGTLTCFADNMVPHVLHCDGILDYASDLAVRIDAGVMIEAGSAEETELRAVAIHAVELMRQAAVAQGRQVTAVNLDHILWNRGYEPEIYARPTHKTMTVWY